MGFFEFRRQLELFGMGEGPGNTAAGHSPVGVPGVWKHPRPGGEWGQEYPDAWFGRPKRPYGELRQM